MGKIIYKRIQCRNGEERKLRIYLPRSYKSSKKSYPVLYMLDGQNLFINKDSYTGISWGVKQTLEKNERLDFYKEMIVVGLDNAGQERMYEYSPEIYKEIYENKEPDKEPYGKEFGEYLIREIKPAIDKNFRTLKDKSNTAIAGSSAGANIALYVALTYPEVFGVAGLFSTATWLFEGEYEEYFNPAIKDNSFFIYVGANEGGSLENIDLSQAYLNSSILLTYRLLAQGVALYNVDLNIEAGAIHHEIEWKKAFPAFIDFIQARINK